MAGWRVVTYDKLITGLERCRKIGQGVEVILSDENAITPALALDLIQKHIAHCCRSKYIMYEFGSILDVDLGSAFTSANR
jgi:hypothetical protein